MITREVGTDPAGFCLNAVSRAGLSAPQGKRFGRGVARLGQAGRNFSPLILFLMGFRNQSRWALTWQGYVRLRVALVPMPASIITFMEGYYDDLIIRAPAHGALQAWVCFAGL